MVNIKNIVSLENMKSPKKYKINFKDGSFIRISSKSSIFPLLFLIDHEKVDPREVGEINSSDVYKYLVENNIPMDMFPFQNQKENQNLGFELLISKDKFGFITKRSFNGVWKYILPKENLEDLLYRPKVIVTEEDIHEKYRELWENQERKCNICGKIIPDFEYEVDLRIPASRGGKQTDENVQILCKDCKQEKLKHCKYCVSVCDNNCGLAYPEHSSVIKSSDV